MNSKSMAVEVVFSLVVIISIWHPYNAWAGSHDEAYEIFLAGQKNLENGDLNRARRILKDATQLVKYDQTLQINQETRRRFSSSSRNTSFSYKTVGDSVKYYPNRLLAKIERLQKEGRERDRLQKKSNRKPFLKVSTVLNDENDDGYFQEDETLKLTVIVKNEGLGPAESVNLHILNNHDLPALIRKFFTSEILPKGEKEFQVRFRLPRDFNEDELRLTVKADERDGYSPDVVDISYDIAPWEPSQLRIEPVGIERFLIPGRAEVFDYQLTNIGRFPAREFSIDVEFLGKGLRIINQDWPTKFKLLKPGQKDTLSIVIKGAMSISQQTPPIIQFVKTDHRATNLEPNTEVVNELPLQIGAERHRYQVGNLLIKDSLAGLSDAAPTNLIKNPIKQTNNYALVIGNQNYNKRQNNVSNAHRNAALMADVFRVVVGIPANQVMEYKDITLEKMNSVLGSANAPGILHGIINKEHAEKAETVYVYYSGNGVPAINKRWSGYLMPSDSGQVEGPGYSLEMLYKQLSFIEAEKIIVFIDANFGKSPSGIIRPQNRNDSLLISGISNVVKDPRIVLIKAARDDEFIAGDKRSLFTNYLAQGMSGVADQGDKKLTIRELFDYVKGRVSAVAANDGRVQTPTIQGNDMEFLQYGY